MSHLSSGPSTPERGFRSAIGAVLPWLAGALVAVAVAIAAYSLAYAVSHLSDDGFQSSLTGNAIATTVGVLLGVPTALAISRWQQNVTERTARQAEDRRATDKRRALLDQLRAELEENVRVLEERIAESDRTPQYGTLEDGYWRAAATSGQIGWIDQPDLLRTVGNAYHEVQTTIIFDLKLMEAELLVGTGSSSVAGLADRRVREGEKRSLTRCRAALNAIRLAEAELGVGEQPTDH